MKIFVFDTETTGFGATDEVIQLSGLVLNSNLECEEYINFYCNPSSIVPPDAVAVHGLTNKFLYEVSGGKTFEDYVYQYQELFYGEGVLFISYNDSFDMKMVNQTLEMNGMKPVNFGEAVTYIPKELSSNAHLCLMRTLNPHLGYRRWQKLEYLVNNHTGMTKEKLKTMYNSLLRKVGDVGLAPKMYHNASFDSFVCWVLLAKYRDFYVKL